MRYTWRVRRLANATGWSLMLFAAGVLAGIALISFLPGMPWLATMRDASGLTPAETLDLGAQRNMASAAWWMVAISGLAGTVGAASLFLIFQTLREAKRSANAAEQTIAVTRNIGMAQTRAYLSASEATLLAYKHDRGLYSTFVFFNSGQSPARNVTLKVTISLHDEDYNLRGTWSKAQDYADVSAGQTRQDSTHINVFDQSFLGTGASLEKMWLRIHLQIGYTDVFLARQMDLCWFDAFLTKEDHDLTERIELLPAEAS